MNATSRANRNNKNTYPMMEANIDGSGMYPYAFGKLVASVMSIIILLMMLLSPLNAPQITRLMRILVIDW
jgi:hypothetical protein